MLFLDSLAEKQREEERLRKEMEGEELKNFRQWVLSSLISSPGNGLSSPTERLPRAKTQQSPHQ